MRDVRHIRGSTRKVTQLTGDYDRERSQDTVSRTATRFGLAGTDLGASFEHGGRLYLLFGDSIARDGYNDFRPKSGDAVAYTTATSPDAVRLAFWTAPDGQYRSPRVRPPIGHGPFEVPVAGVSVDGQMYVYFSTGTFTDATGADRMGRTILTRLVDEAQALFEGKYELSNVHHGGHFINLATAVVDNASVPGLPDRTGRGLLLFGNGLYRASDPYLAYMPLAEIETRGTLRYFSGSSANPAWSVHESEATRLFDQPQLGELSVVWLADVGGWLMLYNAMNPRGINYRFSPTPWGPWTPAQVLFEPWCDGGYGHFIHASYLEHGRIDAVHDDDHEHEWGGEYGPYVIERFTRRNGTQLDVHFVMSTWNPYNTVLMRTTFALSPWRGWYALTGTTFPSNSSIAAVSRHPDRMEVWALHEDGVVRGNWFDGTWRGWYALTGATFGPTARLSAVSRRPDRLEIWAVDRDGHLRGNWFDGSWRGWYDLGGPIFVQGATIAAVSRLPDRMEIWAVDIHGAVWGNWFDGEWRGWYPLPGATFDAGVVLKAVSRHPDRMEIWGIDRDGIVRGNWFDGGQWHGWYELPGATFSPTAALTAVSRHPDRMEIWVVGAHEGHAAVFGNWFDGTWRGWYRQRDLAADAAAPLAAVSRAPERMEAWTIGQDGEVQGKWFDHGWHDAYRLGGARFARNAGLAAVTRHPDRMELWSIDTDGVVRGNWFDAT